MEFSDVAGGLLGQSPRSNNVMSLEQTLHRRVVSSMQHLEAKTDNVLKWVWRAVPIVLGFFAIVLAVPAYVVINQYGTLSQRVDDQKSTIDGQKDVLNEQAKLIAAQKDELNEQRRDLDALQSIVVTRRAGAK